MSVPREFADAFGHGVAEGMDISARIADTFSDDKSIALISDIGKVGLTDEQISLIQVTAKTTAIAIADIIRSSMKDILESRKTAA